jgi:O-Antigen ligase
LLGWDPGARSDQTGAATWGPGCGGVPPSLRIRNIAILCSLVLIVAFQLELLSFFYSSLSSNTHLWPIAYRGLWLLIVIATTACLLIPSVLRQSWPIGVFGACLLALTLCHPLDPISKNFIVGIVFLVCAAILAIAAGPVLILRISAVATAISACLCLIEVLFDSELSNVVGRAAGLTGNPNIAALGLLLGATASLAAVPARFASYFALLVFAAIFATLSKATFLACCFIFGGMAAYGFWTSPRRRIRGPALFALALAAWLTVAFSVNPRFRVATAINYVVLRDAASAFRSARAFVAHAAADRLGFDIDRDSDDDILIEQLGRRAETEGAINSISARGLLLDRAWLVYRKIPRLGAGLLAAHELQPHNSFLLFALAFGLAGWFVPLLFIGLTLTRSVTGVPLAVAVFVAAVTSHDVFLAPTLLAPIAFGMAAARYRFGDLRGLAP